jgi:hypothetical protein
MRNARRSLSNDPNAPPRQPEKQDFCRAPRRTIINAIVHILIVAIAIDHSVVYVLYNLQ